MKPLNVNSFQQPNDYSYLEVKQLNSHSLEKIDSPSVKVAQPDLTKANLYDGLSSGSN